MFTIQKPATAALEIKNSRFLIELIPYANFDQRLKFLRQEHRKASHHVTAYRYFNDQRQLIEHGKDDGEVSGTAGIPALKVLQGHDLVNVAVIIVRYYGGIQLGKGGLARAYGDSAGAGVEAARIIPFAHQIKISLSASFKKATDLEKLCIDYNVQILDRAFTEDGISLEIRGAEDCVQAIQDAWDQKG